MEIRKNRFVQLLKNNFLIIKNAGYLSIVEGLRLLMPFIALPYIIAIIGGEFYGEIIYVQTIISYFIILINWGLDIPAVKDVAENKDNQHKLCEIISSVLFIKLILLIFCFVILLCGIYFIPGLYTRKYLLLITFITCLSEILYPIWFYQGIQKMQYMSIIKVVSVCIYVLLIFLFLKKKEQFERVALFQSISNVVGGITSLIFLFFIEKIRIIIPPVRMLITSFKESIPFFISRISSVINGNMAKLILGIIDVSKLSVSAYDLSQKFCSAMIVPIQMLHQAVYPYIVSTKNRIFVQKFFKYNFLLSIGLASILFVFTPLLNAIFTHGTISGVIQLTYLSCVLVILTGLSTYVGTPILISFGYPRPFNNSVALSTLLMIIAYVLIYKTNLITPITCIIISIGVEAFIFFYRYYYCRKYKIL